MRTYLLRIYDALVVNQTTAFNQWNQRMFPFKIISAVISILLLVAVVYLIIKIRKSFKQSLEMVMQSIEPLEVPKKRILKQWEGIEAKLESDNESDYKMAVIEADKILDDLLVRMGYKGDDMGERLKQITPAQMANIQEVWAAHKVRNRLAHEPDFRLRRDDARRAIDAYERAFEDLELL